MKELLSSLLLTFLCLFSMAGESSPDQLYDADLAYSLSDYPKAVSLYKSIAKQGNAIAQYKLACLYRKGEGLPQDTKEAVKWLRLSAEQGNALAQNDLGDVLANGKIIPKDLKEAFYWIEKAALAGQPSAQTSIGWAYMSDYLGLAPNYKLAMEWNLKASNQGLAEATSNIGLLYEKGWGVPVDYTKACNWHYSALKQDDNMQATFHLAGLYEKGLGIRKNLGMAEMLYTIVINDVRGNEYKDDAKIQLQYVQELMKLQGLTGVR